MKSWSKIFATAYWNIKLEKTLKVAVGLLPACLNSRDQRKKSEG